MSDETVIRAMTAADIPAAMRLREIAGWNQNEADWHRFLEIEPEGCFVACRLERVVGTVTTLGYEKRFGRLARGRDPRPQVVGARARAPEDVPGDLVRLLDHGRVARVLAPEASEQPAAVGAEDGPVPAADPFELLFRHLG